MLHKRNSASAALACTVLHINPCKNHRARLLLPVLLATLLGACGGGGNDTTTSREPTAAAALPDEANDTDQTDQNEDSQANPADLQPESDSTAANQTVTVITDAATAATDSDSQPDQQPTETPTANTAADNISTADINDFAFESASTSGFAAEVSGNSAELRWTAQSGARGYNVYRGGEYITTVMEPRYNDANLAAGSYYYEIISFDQNDNFEVIADALTVYIGVPALGAANAATTLPEHVQQDYQLVFAEEFDGDTLDTSKWNTSYLWGTDLFINSEEQYYVDSRNDPGFGFDPFSVNEGILTIESVRTPDSLREKALGQPYLSGVITSYDSFQFTYGYVEARARTPFGQGFWSAFWLLNAYYVERKPEIDIMEHIGDNRDVIYHTYHYYDANGQLHSTESMETTGLDFTSEFHTYGVEWLPGKIIFYVDGKERHSISDANVSSQSMYIIANTALGGWWPGSPDETTVFPAKYELDYIRAYQKPGVLLDDSIYLNDGLQTIPFADAKPDSPPNRIPTPEQWPEAYPELPLP